MDPSKQNREIFRLDTGVSVVWDNMMTGLGCCGANNYTDFNNIFAGGTEYYYSMLYKFYSLNHIVSVLFIQLI